MIKYEKRKTKFNKVPIWRNQRFPRFHGVVDSLMRKVGLDQKLYGGWFEKTARELTLFEAITVSDLTRHAAPILEAYLEAVQITNLDLCSYDGNPTTTEQARQARAAAARKEQQQKAIQRAISLRSELLTLVDDAMFRIQEAYQEGNVIAAKYSKATCFHPIENQIPKFQPVFQKKKLLIEWGIEEDSREIL
mgnify:CR=1 FL=1